MSGSFRLFACSFVCSYATCLSIKGANDRFPLLSGGFLAIGDTPDLPNGPIEIIPNPSTAFFAGPIPPVPAP